MVEVAVYQHFGNHRLTLNCVASSTEDPLQAVSISEHVDSRRTNTTDQFDKHGITDLSDKLPHRHSTLHATSLAPPKPRKRRESIASQTCPGGRSLPGASPQ